MARGLPKRTSRMADSSCGRSIIERYHAERGLHHLGIHHANPTCGPWFHDGCQKTMSALLRSDTANTQPEKSAPSNLKDLGPSRIANGAMELCTLVVYRSVQRP